MEFLWAGGRRWRGEGRKLENDQDLSYVKAPNEDEGSVRLPSS
jgi:hypothetical protein